MRFLPGTSIPRYIAAFLSLSFVFSTGCTRPQPPLCTPTGMAFGNTWVMTVDCDHKPLVVVWCDLSNEDKDFGVSSGTDRITSRPERLTHQDLVHSTRGVVRLSLDTTDGKADTVEVNGREYRLRDGTLFLVRTRGEPVVTQLTADLGGMPSEGQTWQQLADDNPGVKAFVAAAEARNR